MAEVRNALSKNIQKYRKELNLSQKELADAVGVKSFTTVSSWERGANAPDLETLRRLCEVFKTPIGKLLGFDYYDSTIDVDAIREEISKLDQFEKIFVSLYGKDQYDSFMQYCVLNEEGTEKVKAYIKDLYDNPSYRINTQD